MTPGLEALGRQATACAHWRWLPGMAVADAYGVCGVGRGHVVDITAPPRFPGAWLANHSGVAWLSAEEMSRCLPDLSDPLTVQALLLLVREAWATETAWVEPGHDGLWEMCVYVNGKCQMLASYQAEVEALVAALEAAP